MKIENILEKIAIYGTHNRRNAILDILKDNNIEYRLQSIESSFKYFQNTRYNIIVDIGNNFDKSKEKILLTAHYDVVSGSTGANDNASSVSILLKLIIELKHINKPIRFVFFDGEEMGGIGSNAYINNYNTEGTTLVNLDVCGCGDRISIEKHLNEDNHILDNLLKNNEKYNVFEVESFPFNDAKIFQKNGIDNICIVSLPQEDIDILNGVEIFIDEKIAHKYSFVWQYQHNGKYDSIEYINYEMISKIYNYILELFKTSDD